MKLFRPIALGLTAALIAAACSTDPSDQEASPATTAAPTSTSAPATTAAPTSTSAPATTAVPTTTVDTSAIKTTAQLEAYISQAASFSQSDAAWLLPGELDPKAGGAPGYTRYVFRETSAGVIPSLIEGPLGKQTRCDKPDLPCSYLDLVELQASGAPIPDALNMTSEELATLVDQLNQTAAFAADHTDVNTACAEGFISDQIQTPNMGSHLFRPDWVGDGFFPDRPEILIYAPSDGSLHQGPLGQCVDGVWNGPPVYLTGTAYVIPPSVIGFDHPEAYASDLDNWHSHFNICRGKNTGSDSFVTQGECAAAGGSWSDAIGWMLHAWVVPDFDSQLGVFSMWNPTIAPVANGGDIYTSRNVRGSDFPEGARQSIVANFAFESVIEANVGQSVYFNNSDSVPHTVSAGTADAPDLDSFDSGLLNPGDNYQLNTDQVGSYSLFCILHPDMTATVVVK
ncbi:MAG: hypothetical protein HN567_06640 [Actinobacteria bacterium]|nr:hypothetical protein [Actinomycetota bacterium]MBT3746129.1 hypothetical protein [Actinomycetota bacterium]MBT3968906.1 hypothetical protein [Actinomycetota bacterium]MBT4009547.1 hypothetical protein [Actinomycetota bacterium]MBT4302528.1 hypothetical protein [Actinomycetota bacterium]